MKAAASIFYSGLILLERQKKSNVNNPDMNLIFLTGPGNV
jgi:hypothetical protein